MGEMGMRSFVRLIAGIAAVTMFGDVAAACSRHFYNRSDQPFQITTNGVCVGRVQYSQ
jgi:hypothetical protein